MSQAANAPVCILGMSRSGTSLTARILNVLGVHLGTAGELIAIADDNPTGFWEHEEIKELNEDILRTLGDSPAGDAWRSPPPLHVGWQRDPALSPHRRTAGSILRRSFAGRPLWGWKDPRNCLTLPFWQRLLPPMRYVICVRHPIEVADSLLARDDVPRAEALRLWLRYMSEAVINTRGRARIFVAYERYFPSWDLQALRLASFLGLAELSERQRDAISAYVDDGLRHHRAPSRVATTGDLAPLVDDLYALLDRACVESSAEAELDVVAERIAGALGHPVGRP